MNKYAGIVGEQAESGMRLDRYVSDVLGLLNRSQFKARFVSALINGKSVKISRLLLPGDKLELAWKEEEPSDLIPEDIALDILYENNSLVVVNKAQGLVVHPGAGNRQGTLANALLYRRMSNDYPGGGLRCGIVHRLDKDTSGVIIAAYDDKTLEYLSAQFKNRRVRKTYIALVKGIVPQDTGRIETSIGRDPKNRKRFCCVESGGKYALTLYKTLKRYDGYSLLMVRIKTGRTHQIRVHLKQLGFPILGDPVYGTKDKRFVHATLMLHAYKLSIRLPGEKKARKFKAPLPERFKKIMSVLGR